MHNVTSRRFDLRYSETREARRSHEKQSNPLCRYPGCNNRAIERHHACYRIRNHLGEWVPVRGRETEGVHEFWVCKFHHSRSHPHGAHWEGGKYKGKYYPANWTKGKTPPPALDAIQEPHYYLLLRQGWIEKTERK